MRGQDARWDQVGDTVSDDSLTAGWLLAAERYIMAKSKTHKTFAGKSRIFMTLK